MPPARTLSDDGARLIAEFEGFRANLYDDAAGHCTIGYGHLVHQGRCDGSEPAEFRAGITKARALELLKADAATAAKAVEKGVRAPLEQHQFDALVSFVFNVGGGAFAESTLLRRLNAGDYEGVPEELARWVKAGGKTLPGLVRRRQVEGRLFLGQKGKERQPAAAVGEMSTRDVQAALKELGWPLDVDGSFGPKTFEAVSDFQRGYAFAELSVDGHAGSRTHDALARARAEGGKCSPHFTFREFRSKGNGWIRVNRALVLGLEDYRRLVGGPVVVVSAYRDPAHNARIPGAAKGSQHLHGNAADIAPAKPVADVAALRRFSGLGFQGSTGLVRHVDVRHVGPNTTGGTVDSPTTWQYGA